MPAGPHIKSEALMSREHVTFADLHVGWRRSWRRQITQDDIEATSALTGDQGGYHVDEAFAQAAGFRTIIAPGMLQASLPTKIGGDLNFLAREMNFRFLKPVYAGDSLEVVIEGKATDEEKQLVTFEIEVTNQDGEVVLSGSTTGHLPRPEWGVPKKPPPPLP